MDVRVKLQVAHESLDRPRSDRVDVHFLADRSFMELDILQSLLLFQLCFELLELLLGHVLLLKHLQIGCLRGSRSLEVGPVTCQAQILSLLEPLGEEVLLLLELGLVHLVLFELFLLLAGQRRVVLLTRVVLLLLLRLFRQLVVLVFLLFVELLPQVIHLFFFLGLFLGLLGVETVSLAQFVFLNLCFFVEFCFQEVLVAAAELFL